MPLEVADPLRAKCQVRAVAALTLGFDAQIDAPRSPGLVDDRSGEHRPGPDQPVVGADGDEAPDAVLDDGGQSLAGVGLEIPDPAIAKEQGQRRFHVRGTVGLNAAHGRLSCRLDELGDRNRSRKGRRRAAIEAQRQKPLHLVECGPRALDRRAISGLEPGLDQRLRGPVDGRNRKGQPGLRIEQRLLVDARNAGWRGRFVNRL
jgi:hypothetical protein